MFIRTILAGLAIIAVTAWQAPVQAAGSMYDLGDVKVVKTVWDITTGDEARFNDRIDLIKQTAEGFRSKGITPEFVVLIHGGATRFVTKTVAGTVFAKKPLGDLNATQAALESLTEGGIPVRACGIAMKRTKVNSDNVVKYVTQVDNVFENLIALQVKGYAYMEVE
ncbi:MAG: DsrE family protein [Rhodospirillales bacterium]|nr:DsrE family protein [Rhodospirillales bacterium]